MNASTPGIGLLAARQFYGLLRAKNPAAQMRWREILILARQGDPEAVRAVRLMQSAVQGSVNTGAEVLTPLALEQLRQTLIRARNSTPLYRGPGTYTVIASRGLELHSAPDITSPIVRMLPFNTEAFVNSFLLNGWARISNPVAGYACLSCPELSGPTLIQTVNRG